MQVADFSYTLPPELIAQRPPRERGQSRLMVLDGHDGAIGDRHFCDLPKLLRAGDLLVLNDTRVMRARLQGRKASGGLVEILIERLLPDNLALALVRASKSPRAGSIILVDDAIAVEVIGREDEFFLLSCAAPGFETLMRDHGHVPLPPYIERCDDQDDAERYQTLFATREGAVAAPTAGLHFDDAMLGRLADMGVERATLTLHVGAGTFQPVRVEQVFEHRMHAEWIEVGDALVEQVAATRARGGRIVAVGTTSVRALESAAADGELSPFRGDSRLFITPGYDFRVVDCMLTNFHLPRSTLLMLVSAFAGRDNVLNAYRHAVLQRYRFFSYGDAMLLTPTALATRP